MDYKKFSILVVGLFCLFAFAHKEQTDEIYIIFNTPSCHQCNVELNKYFKEAGRKLRKRVIVTPIEDNDFLVQRAKILYPNLKVKYSPSVIDSIPASLLNKRTMYFPFIVYRKSGEFVILTYNRLYNSNNGNPNIALLDSLFKQNNTKKH
ncbi:MAG: hypothetical protein KF882_06975 [Bacteroidia bacterium]|nr:hypothetical protein [Bacteroidia bacterium]MCO5254450.1 hypothetical protein [Bacteroidota bacterium]